MPNCLGSGSTTSQFTLPYYITTESSICSKTNSATSTTSTKPDNSVHTTQSGEKINIYSNSNCEITTAFGRRRKGKRLPAQFDSNHLVTENDSDRLVSTVWLDFETGTTNAPPKILLTPNHQINKAKHQELKQNNKQRSQRRSSRFNRRKHREQLQREEKELWHHLCNRCLT